MPIVRVFIIETPPSLLRRHLLSNHISEEKLKLPHYPLSISDEESADAIGQARGEKDVLRRKELAERNWCGELPNRKHEADLPKGTG
jgi:hypothetical protein